MDKNENRDKWDEGHRNLVPLCESAGEFYGEREAVEQKRDDDRGKAKNYLPAEVLVHQLSGEPDFRVDALQDHEVGTGGAFVDVFSKRLREI